MLKVLRLSVALCTVSISLLSYLQNPVVAEENNSSCYMVTQSGKRISLEALCNGKEQSLSEMVLDDNREESIDDNENPKVEFSKIWISTNRKYKYGEASGYIRNLSEQTVYINSITVVLKNAMAEIPANVVLEPGKHFKFRNIPIDGETKTGKVTDVVTWADRNGEHQSNFLFCKHFSNIESEKMCTFK